MVEGLSTIVAASQSKVQRPDRSSQKPIRSISEIPILYLRAKRVRRQRGNEFVPGISVW